MHRPASGFHHTIDGYFEAEPWNDPAQYTARSAMTYIKQARTPTLIQHGQADQRVPVNRSATRQGV